MRGKAVRGAMLLVTAVAFAAVLAPTASATSNLSATKTAEASWTRSFTWTIDKSVTPASHDLQTGQSGESTYTIVLTKSAATNSDVTVEGEVCVTNNGTNPTLNLAIFDRIAADVPGGTVTLKSGNLDVSGNPQLDPGEDHCYAYSFAIVPRADATEYRNEAQVTVSNGSGAFPEATFTVPATPTLINDSVNVDDTNDAGDAGPFSSSTSYTYKRTFTCDQDEGTHPNTATIVETGQSDSATVTVRCTPPPDPGCTYTIGYWKTHSKYGPAPYDATWALIGEDTTFFLSGKSWYQAFWTAPAGNAYYILAHQYMGARLNALSGADTSAVTSALASATTLFQTYTPAQIAALGGGSALRRQFIALAGTLADYNEGDIGPGHCDD